MCFRRVPLRGTQVVADLVRAVAVASVPLAWWAGVLSVAQLVVVALVISFADASCSTSPRRPSCRRSSRPIGAALTTRFTRRFGTARGLILAGFAGVAGALLIPQGTGAAAYGTFAVGNLVFAGSVVILSVTTRTYRMTATPPGLLSRVIATVKFVSWGAIPVGGVTAGALAGVLGARMSLLVFGAVTVCAPLVWLLSPMRGLRDLPVVLPVVTTPVEEAVR